AAYSRAAVTRTSRKRWLTPRISTATRAAGAWAEPAPYPVIDFMLQLAPLAEGGAQLVDGDRGGADLGDDHARGVVGEHGSLLECSAGPERQGAGGDDRVAGSGDVEGLARQRRELPHGHPAPRRPFEEGHPL